MKNSFFKFCLWACIPLFSVACSNPEKLSGNEFLIEGKIYDIEDGTIIELLRWDGDAGEVVASDTIRNGRFSFKDEAVSNPERMTINPIGEEFSPMSLGVWVAPGVKINIRGKGKIHPAWKVQSPIQYQKEENLYINKNRDIIVESIRIRAEADNLRKLARKASSENEALEYRKTADSLEDVRKLLRLKELYANMDIMEKTDISPVWLANMRGITQMLKYGDPNAEYNEDLREKAKVLYGKMSEEDKNTHLGYIITAHLFPAKIIVVGDEMADGDFSDINGNTKHLSDYSGKYMLLDFWSIGCAPCLSAFPEMKEISETYSDKLTIISINIDTDARWKDAVSKHDMPWVNIRDPEGMGGLAASYDVRGIPYYVIISPEGKIADKWSGFFKGYIKRKVSENVKF